MVICLRFYVFMVLFITRNRIAAVTELTFSKFCGQILF